MIKAFREKTKPLFLAVWGGIAIACATEDHIVQPAGDLNVPSEVTLSFLQKNFFNIQCATSGCHDSGTRSANLDLSAGQAYDNLVDVPALLSGAGLKRVKPGDSGASFLVHVLDGSDPTRMPLGGDQPDSATLDKVRAWIDAGAKNN
ncbi:MAG: hypothetical protein D6677_05880 [Calditrichaeota bacterium]|nr:MAG: hypothetical protein D6677_05880 [Calditrichota bacterium]